MMSFASCNGMQRTQSIPSLFSCLPLELEREILSYDSTYHEVHKEMIESMKYLFIFLQAMKMNTMFDFIVSHRFRKAFLRIIKKADLKWVALTLHIKLPRHITKTRLLMQIVFFLLRNPCNKYFRITLQDLS